MKVVDEPREMKGAGGPQPTVFGVLGHVKPDKETRTLGGLVQNTKSGKLGAGTVIHHPDGRMNTEHHIIGPASKTHISKAHYGQIPYAGAYMGHEGHRL